MTLFFSLLPLYLFGNFHCASMCGPLVSLFSKHPQRWHYFIGRVLSFTLTGLISGEIGRFFFLSYFSSFFAIFLGVGIALFGLFMIFRIQLLNSVTKKLTPLSLFLTKWLLEKKKGGLFFFGFFTILLPCGQTLIVFSAIALNGSALEGVLNGFLFALLTSPALIAVMHAFHFFQMGKKNSHLWIGGATLFVGSLSALRGFADLNWISHLILNPNSFSKFHLVLF